MVDTSDLGSGAERREGSSPSESTTFGELAEWLNATVLKTVNPARGSWVQIPHSPPSLRWNSSIGRATDL